MRDTLAEGQPFRVLRVLDQWSRQSPLREVGTRCRRDRGPGLRSGVGRRAGNRDLSLWLMRRNSNHGRSKPGRITEV